MTGKKKVINMWQDWSKLWSRVGPPWRPSVKDIKFWEKRIVELDRGRKLRILLLGTTPEIRDMLARHNISVTMLEVNEVMYEAMTKLRKSRNGEEKLVIGDWLKADRIFKKNSFDIAIGDLPHCNVAFKKWPRFFENFYNVLKPGGLFFLATVTYSYPERQTIKQILEKYRKNKKYFANFKNRVWELYQLLDEPGVYDKKERRFNLYKLRKPIIEVAQRDFSRKEIDKNLWFIKNDLNGESFGDVVEVGPPLEEQLALQSKWFMLDELYPVPDHPAFKMRRSMILKSKKSE